MNGTLYIEWDEAAQPPRSRYYGWGEIDKQRVRVYGDIDTSIDHKRVRLVIREQTQKNPKVRG